ncbi:hypothetical protein [Pseudomonas sp. NW5]|uniref:hypothetical protein n=1 Tax=Pseudomonas sp. NW5 TaxID=2934934 RepID=UPI002021400C|nr:hypothetical protein [Pseudomonas sp. NW5]MCL7461561.1 hypothetical protein [Pseudomonas sp. NW5]
MPRRHHRLAGAALCGAVFLTGCANQLPQRSELESRVERRLLDHSLYLDAGEVRTLSQPRQTVRVNEQKTFEVREYEVTRRYQRYTPYQPWRELYELPLGALALVAGGAANLVNVVALGSLPDNVTRGWIGYGLAGINPFMNVESNGRAQQNLAALEEQPRDLRLEHSNLPWSERPVTVRVAGQLYELFTDAQGQLELDLLDQPFSELDSRRLDHLQLRVESDDGKTHADLRLGIEADLRRRLREARALIHADLEGEDVDRWVERVRRLVALQFDEEADELEQGLLELTRHDPELQQELLEGLRRKAGRTPTLPEDD